ncbi:hypothetical protein DL96DRAFT_1619343 [Flagelloscypha sp. PMI_526]|nr:hypothetical protein DL96DRAFT_1619343 [Flagelloscypha sp. PMI_526]
MSRLVIKNLPPSHTTSDSLRSHLLQKKGPGGVITDLKIPGKNRRIAFVGYKTSDEAQKAQEWFNKTFIGMARINVEIADDSKSVEKVKGASAFAKRKALDEEAGSARKKRKVEKDATFEEFKNTFAKKIDGRSWGGDDGEENAVQVQSEHTREQEDEDEQTKIQETGLSDADWLKRRTAGANQLDSESLPNTKEDPQVTTIQSTARLFLRNLSYECSSSDLESYFGEYGTLKQVYIPSSSLSKDNQSQKNPGYAYIMFMHADDAVKAYQALDGKAWMGRLLHILGAVDKKSGSSGAVVEDVEGHKKKTLKQDRADARKKNADGKGWEWSMLWMNPDAVATSVAARMGVEKSQILAESANTENRDLNPAVKLALAETHVINETKSWLEERGVDLSVFDGATSRKRIRDKKIVLIKGIPFGTDEKALTELVQPHITTPAGLKRLLLPPSGTIAVIEFYDEAEAQATFRGIAYRRLGSGIIYLEWGWKGMFGAPKPKTSALATPASADTSQDSGDENNATSMTGGSTLYLKNLSFSTTTSRLTGLFNNLAGFVSARVVTRQNSESMGYGFLSFRTPQDAKKAIEGLKGVVVDGRIIEVDFAGRGREDERKPDEMKGKKKGGTKMIIKNVPFEASKKDLRDLFSAHAPLKSLRVPTKSHSSRSRGFAFMEFNTPQDAAHVMATMKYTHLLGRHLVLDWAEAQDDETNESKLEELRRKTGYAFSSGGREKVKGGFDIEKGGFGEEE